MTQMAIKFERLQPILTITKPVWVAKGELISKAEPDLSNIYLIRKGFVKRYCITSEGAHNTQNIYGTGHIFPLTGIMKQVLNQNLYVGPEDFYYEAMCKVSIYKASVESVYDYIQKEPMLYQDLLKVAGTRLRANIRQMENLGLGSVYKRLAHLIYHFAEEFGRVSKAGIVVKVPLTHQDLADILSISRETVSREIQKLKTKGLIVNSHKYIVVPDLKLLSKVAYS